MKHLIALWAVLWAAIATPASEKHNVLLITADDLGLQLSCYGERRISTPRFDALAAEGVRFANAYVAQSSCSPSRAALLTGRWPHQNGQIGLSHRGFRMYPGQVTLPAVLKAAGYRTGIIGKLHVEPAADFPFDWMPAREKTAAAPTRNVRWVAEQARQFFESAKAAGQPFFFYVNYFDPHGPLTEQTDQVAGLPEQPLRAEDIKEPLPGAGETDEARRRYSAHYLNAVLRLDSGLRLVLDELKTAGFEKNTVVIYTSDNGIALPTGRGKTWSYEAGVRVPLIVRWPGVAKPGQVREETVSLLDVMPTLLHGLGLEAPAGLVGTSFLPLLRGESGENWREFLFTEMNFHTPFLFRPQRTVRDRRYKLLLNLLPEEGQAPVELFDLQTDPDETRNLADDPRLVEVRRKLESALQSWRVRRADPLLDPARLQRWKDAAAHWAKQSPNRNLIRIPEAELDLLK
ncbi:MAG: sulfatase [Verrucomicrobiae bacterium]|nr:sulfatase [Verrucomicrobiae bacterium]